MHFVANPNHQKKQIFSIRNGFVAFMFMFRDIFLDDPERGITSSCRTGTKKAASSSPAVAATPFLICPLLLGVIGFRIMKTIAGRHIIGHLDWNSRGRFLTGLGISLLLFGSLGRMILKPWDSYGAISLLLADNDVAMLIRTAGLLLAIGAFATLVFDARLPLFGAFAAGIGIGLPILTTGGMDYLMVRQQQAGKVLDQPQVLWEYLMMETLAWTILLAMLVGATMFVERWFVKNGSLDTEDVDDSKPAEKEKKTSATALPWLKGLGAAALTAVVALFLIGVFAVNIRKGQVVFAVVGAFFLAALVSEQIVENDHPAWQVTAVPVVALFAYLYTVFHPDRPAGMESLLNIAPNALARALPVEYIFLGTVGAIFGNWTSHRMRHSKDHE